VDNSENSIKEGLDAVNVALRKVVRPVATSESAKENNILLTFQPVVLGFFAIEPGKHVSHSIVNIPGG
jgi:hypothetical protein